MKIILIGFMGTGKSIVAPLLATKLGLRVIEMDDLIVKKSGGKSIKEIFEEGGEVTFRELEIAVGKDLQDEANAVISTGGGVVMNRLILDYLANDAVVVELSASFDTILKRISPAIPRPLFKDKGQAKALYELRKPLYGKYATVHVTTDDKSIEQVVDEIILKLRKDG